MSKRQFKSQASSSRVSSAGYGFGGFGSSSGSSLSYLSEPPNLTSISDANVVVAFKNLAKKDSTTKTKGLEDLRSYVQAHPYEQDGGVEQAILEAWVKQYPRIAIDNSRRVRELSHNLQYELLISARKRMEKHIPSIVGAWLAGTYDRDRPVARAASDGIGSFLNSEDKILSFWRRCQPQILSYAQEAIEETPETLSDERAVSKDDMRAKYDRVIGSSLSLVVNLLAKLSQDDIAKQQETYESFLSQNKTLWKFAAAEDAFVRRTTCQLLIVLLQKQELQISIDVPMLSNAFISDGLKASQLSSAVQLLQALNVLTSKYPEAWTTAYKGKKSAESRLRHFIEKGSQAGSADFWKLWAALLRKIPKGVLPADAEGIEGLLNAQRNGLSSREEARSNATVAWGSYVELVKLLTDAKDASNTHESVVMSAVYPVFGQFLRPSAENARWSTNNNTSVLADLFGLCLEGNNHSAICEEWQRLADLVIEAMLTSLPERSKDHVKSQQAVIAETTRWFNLQKAILDKFPSMLQKDDFIKPSGTILSRAMESLVNRNGKPFGAAGAIEAALTSCSAVVSGSPAIQDALLAFLEEHLPKLVASSSSTYLISALHAFGGIAYQESSYKAIWEVTMDGLLVVPVDESRWPAIKAMLSNSLAKMPAQGDDQLQDFITKAIVPAALSGSLEASSVLEAALSFDALNETSLRSITSFVVKAMSTESTSVTSFDLLDMLAKRQASLLQDDIVRVTLMTKLLAIGESSNNSSIERAAKLRATLERPDSGVVVPQNSILQIIKDNLATASHASLSIDTLANQAAEALDGDGSYTAADVFPDPASWYKSLEPLLSYVPNPSIALTNPLAGAVFLAKGSGTVENVVPGRDSKGYSVAFRYALYTTELITDPDYLSKLSFELQVELLCLLCLTVELANDQLGLQESNELWANLEMPEVDDEVQEFLSVIPQLLSSIFSDAPHWREVEQSSLPGSILSKLLGGSEGTSSLAFYHARSLANVLSIAVENNGWQTSGGEDWLASLGALTSTTTEVFKATAVLAGLREALSSSKMVNTLCNRLISDISGAKSQSDKTLAALVMLNATGAVYDAGELPVAQNRLVFAVRQVATWLEEENTLVTPLAAEACRSLQLMFPCIRGVYGSHWEVALSFVVNSLREPAPGQRMDASLPLYHASMKLLILCRKLVSDADEEEKNDDIEEALKQCQQLLPRSLVGLLQLPRHKENQPWRILDELLCREVAQMPVKDIRDPEDIYPLLAADSRLVQSAAFDLMRRYALEKSESINYDAILEKQDATLPQELLSLLLDAPTYDMFQEDVLIQFPASVRSYLLSWRVVFDYYTKASYKVRSDYNEVIKRENLITPLLSFTFEVLGHSNASAINLDKAGITSQHVADYDYKAASAETNEFDLQWLLVNLYYQCLRYIPNLTKTWWLDCKSKQTRIAVEAWTERFLSPLIIEDTLAEVAQWGEEQESPADDEKELIIKVSKKSKEVYAGYEVDDMQAQIVIRLPSTYPLDGAKVDSVHRVAVSEKKWQSWLMTTQGVILFSNGSITDGLSVFRKNVMGALKGQTECAICYSIVSSDRKMPDKRCQTCKNLFHSQCLFKWFASSNQSTCPLCRNPFTYGDAGRRRGGERA